MILKFVKVGSDDTVGIVGGAVINNDELKVGVGLRKNRFNGAHNSVGCVVDGHNNTGARRVHRILP